jgi:hypothetical protein
MLSILRMTLLWLLALAIPAQGSAAATRLLCGPGHHGEVSRHLEHAVQAMPVHGLAHAPAHQHHPGRTHLTAGHKPPLDAHAWPTSERADPHFFAASAPVVIDPPDGRCIACAACCTAVALPSHMPLLTAPPLMGATPLILAAASRPAFITGGPDRPPRSILA